MHPFIMKNIYLIICILLLGITPAVSGQSKTIPFLKVSGKNIVTDKGQVYYIKGTNLGNWLNPEGYMFGFKKANSFRTINEVFSELVGPDEAAAFWKKFKDNYITQADIDFIASTGANTIRLPFHYKLFTDEDFMGITGEQDGFARIDSAVKWCRKDGLHLVLDMHDAPGGQTGDNIDDSFGYPWLFESSASQQLFCKIWKKIAARYKDEPVILGYELINEPIAPYFTNMDQLNAMLQPVQKMAVKAIREVDKRHIILLGGAQWNTNFKVLTDTKYDNNIMFTCHRYGGEATVESIHDYIAFRDSVNLPMYMGEMGHNTEAWSAAFCKIMRENNIGYTFWPYKKIENSCFVGYPDPENWEVIKQFAETPRETYDQIRKARPSQEVARKALASLIESVRFSRCTVQKEYIDALGLK